MATSTSTTPPLKAPPFNLSLESARNNLANIPPLDKVNVLIIRSATATFCTAEKVFGTNPSITHSELIITAPDGAEIKLAIVRTKASSSDEKLRPAIYYIHGGGLVIGNRFTCSGAAEWVTELDIVFISVEYRLAPEHPYPLPLRDCYTGFKYIATHASSLGIDAARIMVAGTSAGGNLAAAVTLVARDRAGPKIHALCLICPMLDDRMDTISVQQFAETGAWKGVHNSVAWDWYLSGKRGMHTSTPGSESKDGESDGVSPYAAPARAVDLSGLPNTWVEVGSADMFRDEDVDFARRIWEAGGVCELHVWPGGRHGFGDLAAGTDLADVCTRTRLDWMRRVLK